MQSIVIPIYNRPEHFEKTLEGILQYCIEPYEVVIVADCPKDPKILELAEAYRSKFKQFKLIVNPENYDLCKTNNIGMDAASSDVLIHLEGDIIIPISGWNKMFEDFLTRFPEVGLVTPSSSLRNNLIKTPNYYYSEWALGGVFSITKKVYEDVGGWCIFMKHQRECDYCLRVQMEGYRVAGHPQIHNWIHLGENDALETDERQALMNIGVHNFLKKWNRRFFGSFLYSSIHTMSWDDFPIIEWFRRLCMCGEKLNRNPQKVNIPRGPFGSNEKVSWPWDLVFHTRPVNREREEELEKQVRENVVFKDGESLEERMKGRSYVHLCEGKELDFRWICFKSREDEKRAGEILKQHGIEFSK